MAGFVLIHPLETMEILLFPVIIALSFAWMWSRNDQAKKGLGQIRIVDGIDEAAFGAWKLHTRKRMGRADLAAALFTLAPLAPFLPLGAVLLLISGPVALGLAFAANSSGRKADGLAKQLGLKRGVQWLAAKRRIPGEVTSEHHTDNPTTEHPMSENLIEPEPYQLPEAFEVWIPEGDALAEGYVEIPHNTQYSLLLRNRLDSRCDAEVSIDGIPVGVWRIARTDEIRIERPAHDPGRFTFFVMGSPEASLAGIKAGPENGLISVTFKPESNSTLFSSRNPSEMAGGTGLTGESDQRFTGAPPIIHDPSRAFTIHLRLIAKKPDVRPLAPRSTSIPPRMA